MDINKLKNRGWTAKTDLKDGIKKTYKYYIEEVANK